MVVVVQMYEQTRKVQDKQYNQQQRELREAKKGGASSKQAVEKVKGKAAAKDKKGGKKKGAADDADDEPRSLLERPKDYNVKFHFPDPPPLQPPILGLSEVDFGYPGQEPLFKKLDIGSQPPSLAHWSGLEIGVVQGSTCPPA